MELDEALELAATHHAGQADKAGRPYIGHILRVVGSVDGPEEKLAAALHDLLEDTPVTSDDLLSAGCPSEVVTAVIALTRLDGEDYDAFITRAAQNPIAALVKRADLADNSDESRLALLPSALAARLRTKYANAVGILDGACSADASTKQDPPPLPTVVHLVALDRHWVDGSYDAEGCLVLSGQDLNGSEYEWQFTIHPQHFDAVRRLLGGGGNVDVLKLLATRVAGLPGQGPRDPGSWLRDQGIPVEFWNWWSVD